MSDKPEFLQKVGEQENRKLKTRARGVKGVWLGLGMFGLVGWAVVLPTLLGLALGVFVDGHHPGRHSWTLSLLIVGLALGCLNAWHWVAKEEKAMWEDA